MSVITYSSKSFSECTFVQGHLSCSHRPDVAATMEEIETTATEVSKLSIHHPKAAEPPPSFIHDVDASADETDAVSVDYDSFDESSYERPAERWAPLGAAVSPTPSAAEPRSVKVGAA